MSGLVAREGAHRVSVETLSPSESVRLLRTVLDGYRTGDTDTDLDELARLCAHLPLALRIVAERAAARPHMHVRDLIAELRDESGLWDALSAEFDGDSEQADAVHTVFAWSYRALTAATARVFRLLGLHPGPEFDVRAAATLVELAPSQARRQLDGLAGANLLEECGHDRYQFHDLLRAYALDQVQREETEDARRTAQRRVLVWYLHTADAAAKAGSNAYTLPVELEPLASQVPVPAFDDANAAIAWYEAERDNLIGAVRIAHRAGLYRIAWQIPAVLTMIIADREPAGTWLTLQELALDAARQLGDRYGEALTLDNLGIAHRHQLRLAEAERDFTAALTAFQAVGNSLGQARAANGLGVVYLYAHRLDDAVNSFKLALSLAGGLGDPVYAGAFTRNLGWALLERGDLVQAEESLRDAEARLRDINEPLEQSEALSLLATVLRQSERYELAKRTAEQALAIAGESQGTLFEAFALHELGRIALASSDGGQALDHFHQATALFQRVGRPELQAVAWDATGQAYQLLGRPKDAAEFHRRAVATHQSRNDQWSLALALANLADALDQDGDPLEARQHREEAIRLLAVYTDPPARAKRTALEVSLGNS
jgi:tetratricopeptide (TPR) repeat protein